MRPASGDLVMLYGLCGRGKSRVHTFLSATSPAMSVGFRKDAVDRRTRHAFRLDAMQFENSLQPDLMRPSKLSMFQFAIRRLVDHLRQRLHDLTFSVINIA